MDLIVIILAALLLIGSISIAIPSRSSREISKIRMEAKLIGCKIASNLYGENKFKNQNWRDKVEDFKIDPTLEWKKAEILNLDESKINFRSLEGKEGIIFEKNLKWALPFKKTNWAAPSFA